MSLRFTTARLAMILGLFASLAASCGAAAAGPGITAVSLDAGFRLLYNLQFAQAHTVFTSWEQLHPKDPLGPASDAAGLLFSEFNRLGVLESQFYTSDQ